MLEIYKEISTKEIQYQGIKALIDPNDRTNNKRLALNQCARLKKNIDELKEEIQKLKEEAYKF